MTLNGAMVTGIVSNLKSNTSFSDLSFVEAYENEIKPTPLSKPIVAVSVKNCKIGEKIVNVLENGVIEETVSRPMNTTISVDIFLPYTMGGSKGHIIFDRIATYFIFTKKLNIIDAGSSGLEYDKSCEALVLRTYFVINNTISS